MRKLGIRPTATAMAIGVALTMSACGRHAPPNNSSSGQSGSSTMGNGTVGNV